MADRAGERHAIVLALTAEQTARIRQATGIVVTELTIHVAGAQGPQETRPFPPGPYATFPPGPSAEAYPRGPSRT